MSSVIEKLSTKRQDRSEGAGADGRQHRRCVGAVLVMVLLAGWMAGRGRTPRTGRAESEKTAGRRPRGDSAL